MANGSEGNTLAYTAIGLPPGLTIDPESGIISGSIDHSANFSNDVRVSVQEIVSGTTVTQPFGWAVTPRATPRRSTPQVLNPGSQTGLAGSAYARRGPTSKP